MPAVQDVRINSQSVVPVRSARTASAEGDDTGEAEVTLEATSTNRQYGAGDELVVEWSGASSTWVGEIVGTGEESNGVLTYRALGDSVAIKHDQSFRVFYETDSGEAVKSLIEEEAEQLSQTEVHSGDTPSDWESAAPVAEPYAGNRAGLYDFGTDLLFIGCRTGHSQELRTTYTDVGTREIADGFYELETRLIAPFVAEWEWILELKTPGGTSYRWEPDLEPGAATYTLEAQDATAEDSGLNAGELRYRFIPRGQIATNTGFFIDAASTIPFRVSSRQNPLGTTNVETTGRTITRKIDGSAGGEIAELAIEDQAAFWVDSGEAYYVPGTTAVQSLSIDQSTTPVRSVPEESDFESVRNEIFVQGADGVEAIARDQRSIGRLGRARPKKVSAPQIVREDEAQARAEGELASETKPTELTFEITDMSYADLRAGQQVAVDWPRRSLNGNYDVVGVVARSEGVVSVTIETEQA